MKGKYIPKILHLVICIILLTPSLGVSDDATPLSDTPDSNVIWEVFHPAWRPEAGYSELRRLAMDPNRRLEPDFRIPPPLVDRVLFWATVYSQFTSRMRIVHDRDDPRILYGYLDFNPLYRTERPQIAEKHMRRIEAEVKSKLAMALSEAAQVSSMSPLGPMDKMLFKQFLAQRQHETPESIKPLVDNIRTQSGQSDVFQTALERSELILPVIEQVFEKQGLPKSLAKIPFVESSFNTRARSKIGAMGLWQFIPATARALINRHDKRQWSDPIQQTEAAAEMLKRLRRALPDWGTAVTSYNSGVGRISRMLRSHQLTNATQLVALKEEDGGLGFAGRNFYTELLAANLVEAYKTELFSPRALAQDKSNIPSLRELSFAPSGVCRLPRPSSALEANNNANYVPSEEPSLSNDSWVQQKLKETSTWLGEAFRHAKKMD